MKRCSGVSFKRSFFAFVFIIDSNGNLLLGIILLFRVNLPLKLMFEVAIAKKTGEDSVSRVVKYIIFCCLYGCFDLAYDILCQDSVKYILSKKHREVFLTRIPKIQNRCLVMDFTYHFYMLALGIHLKYFGYYKNSVKL